MVKRQLLANRKKLLDALNDPEALRRLTHLKRTDEISSGPESSEEEQLADWLGRLKLLHGVPFHYLVPNVTMLPMESIRFFYVDSIWLDYLVEGALSIGRATAGDRIHDRAFGGDLHRFSRFGVSAQRKKILEHLRFHLEAKEKSRLENAAATPVRPDEKITGFLLRSGVVSGWEGLQAEAFFDAEGTKPCKLLRMDHLSPNVLLCLYEGLAKKLVVHEYPEVLHFGVDIDTSGSGLRFSKSFRYIVDHDGHAAGEQVPENIAPPIAIDDFVRTGAPGVLRVDDLARAVQGRLKQTIAYNGPFTSAGFALEMVEGVEAVNFKIEESTDHDEP